MFGKMSFVFDLLIAIVVLSSASKVGWGYNIIKDFFTGNINVPIADRTLLQKSAYVKCCRLRKRLEGNLLYEKKKIVKKSDL